MVNRLDCGTTERDREIVKDVSSGIPRCHIKFTSCVLKQADKSLFFLASAPNVQMAKGQFSWMAKATRPWGDPPGGTQMFPQWPSSYAHSHPMPCSCI